MCVNWAKTQLINQSIQFWSGFIPVNRGSQIYPTLTAISPTPTLHLTWFMASSLSKPPLLLFFSTCVFHVFFGCPRFLLPFTSNYNAFLKTSPSSHLNTCPYHLTPFAFAIWTIVSFNAINATNAIVIKVQAFLQRVDNLYPLRQ